MNRKVRIYVAGPITGSGSYIKNIRNGILAAQAIYRAGMIPFVPHLYALWDMICPESESNFLAMDEEWLYTCDALLRLPGESPGADLETKWCKAKSIPVYISLANLINDLQTGVLQCRQ